MTSKGQRRPAQRNEFARIATAISTRIESGEFLSGTLLPTEKQIQDEYGVSRTTVRRALGRLIEAGWAKAIPHRGVMVMGGMAPNSSKKIAFVGGSNFVLQTLASRFTLMLAQFGYEVEHVGDKTMLNGRSPISHLLSQEIAGAIIWNSEGFPDQEVVRSLAANVPVASLVHDLPDARIDHVCFDEFQAAYDATTHLINCGCKRVGITGMMDMLKASHQRFSGYLKALFDADQQPEVRDFLFSLTSGMATDDPTLLYRRVKEHHRPDGLLVLNDISASASIQACLRVGLRIPEDMRIVALGDEVELSINGVGMTTVAYDWDAMAGLAVETLIDRIKNPIRPARISYAPHRLIIRGLCGAPSSAWTLDPDQYSGFHGNLPVPREQHSFSSSWSVRKTDPRP